MSMENIDETFGFATHSIHGGGETDAETGTIWVADCDSEQL
jgi:hypothetical protein